MGTWGSGPFENDATADFLAETAGSPHELAAQLGRCADAPADEYIDVDDGQPAIAICELIALGFGYGNLDATTTQIRSVVRRLGPNQELRLLAIRALERVRVVGRSEIASLWEHDPAFDAQLADLLQRLTAAGE